MSRPRIGISSCLLGDEVRFDGGHKRESSLADVLGPSVEWVRVCPEVEIGLGVPREPLRLERSPLGLRLITVQTRVDHTDAMREYARRRVDELAELDLSGYVLKSKSPSCGLRGVTVFDQRGAASAEGAGLFAAILRERLPELPIEEESTLADAAVRDAFLKRASAHAARHGRHDG
jgi:uncharacterized protein YbbK (DUF523 family)